MKELNHITPAFEVRDNDEPTAAQAVAQITHLNANMTKLDYPACPLKSYIMQSLRVYAQRIGVCAAQKGLLDSIPQNAGLGIYPRDTGLEHEGIGALPGNASPENEDLGTDPGDIGPEDENMGADPRRAGLEDEELGIHPGNADARNEELRIHPGNADARNEELGA